MKIWTVAVLIVINTLFANACFADEAQTMPFINEIPTDEKAFVDIINKFDKLKIVELLGEPAKAEDVKIKGTDKVVASIWHYHNLNTDADGTYYPTTELDFIDDKVVQVVFLNNDGSEPEAKGQTYETSPPEHNASEPNI
jgi:hypothetical protein